MPEEPAAVVARVYADELDDEAALNAQRFSSDDLFDGDAPSSSAPPPAARAAAIGPAWTRGDMEPPAGAKDMGSWTAAVPAERNSPFAGRPRLRRGYSEEPGRLR